MFNSIDQRRLTTESKIRYSFALAQNSVRRIFSKDALYFAFVANVLPSMPFFVLAYYVCVPRLLVILLYFLLAVISMHINVFVLVLLAGLIAFLDVVLVVSEIYRLSPALVIDSIKYSTSLDVFSFAGYTLLAVSVLVCVGLYVFELARNRQTFKKVSLLPVTLLCGVVLGLDVYLLSMSSQKVLVRYQWDQTEFSSAINQTDLSPSARSEPGENVLVVMVEGMGAFADPEHQSLLWDVFKTPEVEAGFEIRTGTSPYFGSTTSAESRELCGRWGDYTDYLKDTNYDCLPARFAAMGYETAAFHAFTGEFFDRDDWFPHIGFQNLFFAEQLKEDPTITSGKTCGLTFDGLCDLEVANVVENWLTNREESPRFAYWLTLNTHLPLERNLATPRLDCEAGGPFDNWDVCTMTEMWIDVMHRVREIASNPDLEDTQILVVGDHHPPVLSRKGRLQFASGEVAWLHLKPKTGNAVQRTASVAAEKAH